MRQNPHVRICGGPGSATTLVYPTPVRWRRKSPDIDQQPTGGGGAMGPADASLVLSVSSVVSQNSADGSS